MPEVVGENTKTSTYLVSFSRRSILTPPCTNVEQHDPAVKEMYEAEIDKDAMKVWRNRKDDEREALTVLTHENYGPDKGQLESGFELESGFDLESGSDSESRGFWCTILSLCLFVWDMRQLLC